MNIPPGERILWTSRPSTWSIVLRPAGLLAALVLIAVLLWQTMAAWAPAMALDWLVGVEVVLVVAVVLWNALLWSSARYSLTDRRLIWESGVLRRLRVEAPTRRIQNVVMLRRLRERLLGLGTLGFATAGTDGYEIVWSMVAAPDQVLAEVRRAMERSKISVASTVAGGAGAEQSGVSPIPVIGLAGGIGAGKSEVARILKDLGCLVLDSDTEARATLDEPEVRGELVRWWGDRVLKTEPDDEGVRRVDRRAVATIVFADPAERTRLERLIHPRLKETRRRAIEQARGSTPTPPAIVIDAPLLYEAGVDAECDSVIFVDTPADLRLARVTAARGWDRAELARREAAQWPLEDKRRRAAFSVINRADLADLEPQVRRVFAAIVPGGRPTGPESSSPSNR